jgi:hypothetical protein
MTFGKLSHLKTKTIAFNDLCLKIENGFHKNLCSYYIIIKTILGILYMKTSLI